MALLGWFLPVLVDFWDRGSENGTCVVVFGKALGQISIVNNLLSSQPDELQSNKSKVKSKDHFISCLKGWEGHCCFWGLYSC